MKKLRLILYLCIFLLFYSVIPAQEINIEKQLNAIETGNFQSAEVDLEKMKQQNPRDPSVIYLDALMTTDGKKALEKYKTISEQYPNSKYADAAVYQIYCYYFASGSYSTSNTYLEKLRTDYSNSSYLKLINNKSADAGNLSPQKNSNKEMIEGKTGTEKKELFKYTIQSGAFLVQANAEKLNKSFLNSGLKSEINEKKIGGSTFFIVNVGKFKTEDEAKSFLVDLNKNKKMEGRVVEIK